MARPKKDEINERVPKAGTEFEMDNDKIKEMALCADEKNGIFHFAQNYFMISTLDDGIQKIDLYPKQKKQIKRMIDPEERFHIVLASRQTGKSTMMALIALWFVLFRKNFHVLLLANKEDTAQEIFSRIRMAYEEVPAWLKPGSINYAKTSMILQNGSKISISTTTSDAGRGKTINLLLLDEFAFVEKSQEFYASVYPVISSSKTSRIIICSTPNGTNNMFYELVQKCLDDEKNQTRNSRFQLFKIHYSDVPGRGQRWIDETKKGLPSEDAWRQEFECVMGDTPVNIENMGYLSISEVYNNL